MFRKLLLLFLLAFSALTAQENRLEKLIQEAKEKKITPKAILEIENLVEKSSNDTLKINAYTLLGKTYEELEVYDKTNQFYQKSLNLAKKKQLTNKIGYCIVYLGALQYKLGNFEKSLQLHTEAKKHFQKVNNYNGLVSANANIAVVFGATGREQEAIKLMIPIINDKRVKQNVKASLLINLGALSEKLNNSKTAIKYYLEAISTLESIDNMEQYKIMLFQNLAESYVSLKQYDTAYFYNHKSEVLIQKDGNNELKAALYFYYAQIYEGKLQFREAYKNFKLHKKFNDLSEKAKATLKFENIETLNKLENQKLDIQIKEQKIRLLESEKFATRIRIFFLVLLIIGILLLSFYLIKKQRSKVKSLSHVIHQTEDKLEFTQTKTDKMVLNIVKNNDFIERFKENLKRVQTSTNDSESKAELSKLLFELQNFKLVNDTKEELFNQVDAQFSYKLNKKYPELTEEEQKICILIYLDLKNKDMAVILNLSLRSVENCRYRIRKKMNLEANENLSSILQTL